MTLTTGSPPSVGLSAERLERALALIEGEVAAGYLPAAAVLVARRGVIVAHRAWGRQRLAEEGRPCQPDTVFLVASVTKPVTCAAALLLVERGQLALSDAVADVVPEFSANGKEGVQILHLLTHTSGLPDMLPENEPLRAAHQPLSEFIRRVCALPLDFPPGTNVQYQSMGIALLAEIVQRVSGVPCAEFLRREMFEPLGLADTSLGARADLYPRIAEVNIPEAARKTDWHWNTPYWWHFGAPWGGMFSTVKDLAVFLQTMLNGGRYGDAQVFSASTVQAMIADQTARLPNLPPEVKLRSPWGLGWWLAGPHSARYYGDLLSPRAFGHGGATGTVVWADPATELLCVLFTTQPGGPRGQGFARMCNAVAGSVET
jgi:CubicO group peptidase (beta-lactamase class C family)